MKTFKYSLITILLLTNCKGKNEKAIIGVWDVTPSFGESFNFVFDGEMMLWEIIEKDFVNDKDYANINLSEFWRWPRNYFIKGDTLKTILLTREGKDFLIEANAEKISSTVKMLCTIEVVDKDYIRLIDQQTFDYSILPNGKEVKKGRIYHMKRRNSNAPKLPKTFEDPFYIKLHQDHKARIDLGYTDPQNQGK